MKRKRSKQPVTAQSRTMWNRLSSIPVLTVLLVFSTLAVRAQDMERAAAYCKAHPNGVYGAPGAPDSVDCSKPKLESERDAARETAENEAKQAKTAVTAEAAEGLLLHRVAPEYPSLAKQARIQGSVVLRAVIGTDGTVQKLDLISGHPMLAPAAIEAVKQWLYKPYYQNGKPVSVETPVTVNFSLSASDETVTSPAAQRGQERTPPQSLIDYVKKGVEGYCTANKDKEPDVAACVARYVNSEKFKPLQFFVTADYRDDYDGLLVEFNTNDCEAKAECQVAFFVPLKLITGADGWQVTLNYKGNLQSVGVRNYTNGTQLGPSWSAAALTLNGHTWQYWAAKGVYYDYDKAVEDNNIAQKQKEQEEQAQFQRNSAWLRKTALALPVRWGQSQPVVKEILERSGYRKTGINGAPWICESSGWQRNNSDFLAKQGVVEVLMTSCVTEYRQGENGLRLVLAFELGQRKVHPDRGTIYEVPTDRLGMAMVSYENKNGEQGEGGRNFAQSFKRMSEHDCAIDNDNAKKYDNGGLCIPF